MVLLYVVMCMDSILKRLASLEIIQSDLSVDLKQFGKVLQIVDQKLDEYQKDISEIKQYIRDGGEKRWIDVEEEDDE